MSGIADYGRRDPELYKNLFQKVTIHGAAWKGKQRDLGNRTVLRCGLSYGSFLSYHKLCEIKIRVSFEIFPAGSSEVSGLNELQTSDGREEFIQYVKGCFRKEKERFPECKIPEVVFELPEIGSHAMNPIILD